jgi:hypothetical protein
MSSDEHHSQLPEEPLAKATALELWLFASLSGHGAHCQGDERKVQGTDGRFS